MKNSLIELCRKTERIMIKPDKTVMKETLFVTAWTFGFSAVMNAVFVIIKKWDYTVLTGSLLSSFAGALNFFVMGIVVQGIIANKTLEPKDRQQRVKLSFILRMIALAAVLALGIALPVFNTWAVVIPMFFPTLIMRFIRPLFGSNISSVTVKREESEENTAEETPEVKSLEAVKEGGDEQAKSTEE